MGVVIVAGDFNAQFAHLTETERTSSVILDRIVNDDNLIQVCSVRRLLLTNMKFCQ